MADQDVVKTEDVRGAIEGVADYDAEETETARGPLTGETTSMSSQAEEKAGESVEDRRAVLFGIFEEMKGQAGEFLADGRPRVESVNDRLEGGQPRSNREEIDPAFEAWQQQQEEDTGE